MNVRVQMFAVARQLAGREVVELHLPAGVHGAGTARVPGRRSSSLASLMPHLMFAINAEYAGDDAVIPAGAEIACIPPVSGG